MYAYEEEGVCPSCGRYIGPREVCPYCGAKVKKRISVRLLKYSAVAMAILGLLLVQIVAVKTETPLYHVSEIKRSMNYAHIKMAGTVVRYPSIYEDGSMSFWIDDGTGEIMVKAYRFEANRLIENGLIPGVGDYVEVEGSIRIREEFQYLVVELPSKFKITWANETGLVND